MTVDEVIKKFLNHPVIKKKEPETRRRYTMSTNKFAEFCEKKGITEFSENIRDSATEYAKFLAKKGNCPKTINFEMGIVRRMGNFFGVSLLGKFEFDNSFSYTFSSKERQDYQLRQSQKRLSEDDIEKLLAHRWARYEINLRNHLMLKILIDTGVRVGELCGITKTDIDTSKREIFISTSKTMKRWVFISPHTAQVADAYLKTLSGQEGSYQVFPDKKYVWEIILRAMDEQGIKKPGMGAHAFRHYTITNLYYNLKMPIEVLAPLMGDKEATIQNNYLHPEREHLKAKMNEVMGWT